ATVTGVQTCALPISFLIAVAILVFVYNVWRSRTRGTIAPNDPWGGATLEWSIPSPPPPYNFSVIPTVTHRLARWRTERHEPMERSEERRGGEGGRSE